MRAARLQDAGAPVHSKSARPACKMQALQETQKAESRRQKAEAD
jgi:hypothetical protein